MIFNPDLCFDCVLDDHIKNFRKPNKTKWKQNK